MTTSQQRKGSRITATILRGTAAYLALACATADRAKASSFSVGGGTIATTIADIFADNTGTGGPFNVQANTTTAGDTISITGVTINNTSGIPGGGAIDIGYSLPSAGSYSVHMNGSNLTGKNTTFAFIANSSSGTVTLDTTQGPPNTVSGGIGLAVFGSASNVSVVIKTGADTITTSGATGEILYGVAQGTGTVSIDSIGATLTSSGAYGISALAFTGAITIGGLNGGIASNIDVSNGWGIFTSSVSPINVTLASSGSIHAKGGIHPGGGASTVDIFGTIVATSDPAIDGGDHVTLEAGSSITGLIFNATDVNVFTGANIGNATFDGGAHASTIDLKGSGSGTFDVSKATNISNVQKDDAGVWTLTRSAGPGASTAAFLINAGTLQVNNLNALGTRPITIGGTLRSTVSGTMTNDINIVTGTTGTISVAPGQALNLTGAWQSSGNQTHVIFGSSVDTGTVAFAPSGPVSANQLSLLEIAGGTLQEGNGHLSDLTGSALSTLVDAGATLDFSNNMLSPIRNLQGAGRVLTSALTTLEVSQGNFSGSIQGAGTFTQFGTGTTILTGVNTYAGGTTINAGTLQIGDATSQSARIAGPVIVNAGATLRGHGTIGGNVTNTGGTVAPGGSIGTLTVNGNYTQTGGILAVEVSPAVASLLNVGGAANLNNAAALVLTFNAGNYPVQQSFTILHSASLVGSFASVTETGLPPSRLMNLTQSATDIILTLSSSLIAASTPATPNQSQVAAVLNNAFGSASGNLLAVHDALLNLSPLQQQQALTEISGVILTSAPTVAVGQAQAANSVVLDRVFSGAENTTISAAQSAVPLRLAFAGSQENLNQIVAQARAAMEDDATSAARTVSDGFWLQGTGDWGAVNGKGSAPGWSSHGGGVMAGYEHAFADESRLGAAFAYGHADGDEKSDSATTSLDTYRLVFYGGFDDGPLMAGGALDLALDRFDASRPISLGALTPVATSSHDGNEISASAMAGYRLSGRAMGVMPFISADYVYLHQRGFTETDAGALNLSIMPSHFQSLQPEIGVRAGHVFALQDDVFIVPVLTVGFRYELLDTTANNSALLASATSAGAFTTDGVALDRAMAHIGAKVVVHMRNALDLYAAYDARLSGNQSAQAAGLGVRYQF